MSGQLLLATYRKSIKLFFLICVLFLVGCKEATIYKNIEETEANLMTSILIREGIETQRMANPDGTYNIIISDETYFPEAIDALTLRGFPRTKYDNLCTIFKGEGMVSTPIEQKARYTCAKAQELSGSLAHLDGISMARVHLVLSETDPISRQVKPASASVMIKYKSGIDVDTLLPKVKQLVSFGVEGLPYQNVSVMFTEETGRTEEMIARAYKKSDEKDISQAPNLFPEENTRHSQGTIILYLVMAVMTVGMVLIVFFMLKMKKTNTQERYRDMDNPENLPVEF